MSELTVAAIKKLKVAELKAELTKRGLPVKGKKDELAKRLIEAVQQDSGEAEVNQEDENQDADDSQLSLNESQDFQGSENTTLVSENAVEEEDSGIDQSADIDKTEPSQVQQDDDWVMVEAPKVEEIAAAKEAAESQQQAAAEATQKDEPMEQETSVETPPVEAESKSEEIAPETDIDKKVEVDQAAPHKEEPMEQQSGETKKEAKKDEPIKEEEVKSPSKDTSTDSAGKVKTSQKESPQKPEVVQEDQYVEVEFEDGEDLNSLSAEEGNVVLDSYTSDLNFVIDEKGLSGHTLIKNGMAFMWGGARATKGTKGGKVGYEVKILEAQTVDLPESEAPIHGVRIGWSTEKSSMQLGESSHSYGYESTGKLCASSSFVTYGETFEAGDVIGTFLDLESDPKTLKYTKNGKDLGIAMSLTVNIEERPLFPHVLARNMRLEVNFGGREEAWFEPLEGYTLLQNTGEEKVNDTTFTRPENEEQCEILLMVGLPNAGKTTWVKKYTDSHPEKCYNVIGIGHVLDRCRLEGKRRKKTDSNHLSLMKSAVTILGKFYQMCPKRARNYIYDQTNIYETAQKTKMEPFGKFQRKAILVVPTHDNLRRRTSEAKRKADNIHDIPFADLCDMKCEFHVPEVGDLFHEIIYPELDEKNSKKTVRDYQSDGARAKRTGRDEFYPKKKARHDDRGGNYGRRDRYSSGSNRRDDGWKNSGSGYSSGGYGNYKGGRSNYGSGGYKGRDQYQDPYRRNSGGSGGGYRQHSYSGGNSGGSYNKSGSYGSGSSYGGGYNSGSYGSNYGSNYNSGYGNYGGSSYSNYGGQGYSQQSSNRDGSSGGWGQYNSSSSYNQGSQQSGGWGSNSGSSSWGNYNYGNYNYNNSSYGSGSGGYGY